MLYSIFKKVVLVLSIILYMDTLYGKEIKELLDIVDDSIPNQEKIEFLENLKNQHNPLNSDDFYILNSVIYDFDIDLRIKNSIFELLLNEDVENIPEFFKSSFDQHFSFLLVKGIPIDDWYPSLKFLAKLNIAFPTNQGFLFIPFSNQFENKTDKDLLRDYEKYLVKNLKYFNKDNGLGNLEENIKERLSASIELDLKLEYVNAMLYLDMWKALLDIISDTSMGLVLRKHAIHVSLKLLSHHDYNFEKFSEEFLKILHQISIDPKEKNELKNISDFIIYSIKLGRMSLRNMGYSSDCTKLFTRF